MNGQVKLSQEEQTSLMEDFQRWQQGGGAMREEEPTLENGMSMGLNGQRPQRLPRVPPVPVKPPVTTQPQQQFVPQQQAWQPAQVEMGRQDLGDREFYLLQLVDQHGYTIQGHSANRINRVITLVLEY